MASTKAGDRFQRRASSAPSWASVVTQHLPLGIDPAAAFLDGQIDEPASSGRVLWISSSPML
jgi:hypothetical protein